MENVEKKIYVRLYLDTENKADYRKGCSSWSGCSRKSACALIIVLIVLTTKLGLLKMLCGFIKPEAVMHYGY